MSELQADYFNLLNLSTNNNLNKQTRYTYNLWPMYIKYAWGKGKIRSHSAWKCRFPATRFLKYKSLPSYLLSVPSHPIPRSFIHLISFLSPHFIWSSSPCCPSGLIIYISDLHFHRLHIFILLGHLSNNLLIPLYFSSALPPIDVSIHLLLSYILILYSSSSSIFLHPSLSLSVLFLSCPTILPTFVLFHAL